MSQKYSPLDLAGSSNGIRNTSAIMLGRIAMIERLIPLQTLQKPNKLLFQHKNLFTLYVIETICTT